MSPADLVNRVGGPRPVGAVLLGADTGLLDRSLFAQLADSGAGIVVVSDDDEPEHSDEWLDMGADSILELPFDSARLMEVLAPFGSPCRVDEPSTSGHAAAADPDDRLGVVVHPAHDTAAHDSHAAEQTVPPDGGAGIARRARPTREADPLVETAAARGFRGSLLAVVGVRGTGTSTIAMAIAQGAARGDMAGSVLLADLARRGDLAMYHDVGDVVPGLQEVVEAHRGAPPARAALRSMLFDIDTRGYGLLLGLRRDRDWVSLRYDALVRSLDALRSMFRLTVADCSPDLDGRLETGSRDVEGRNAPGRVSVLAADAVVAVGDPTLRGMRSLVELQTSLVEVGVDPSRILRVLNRAPRSPRVRSELTSTLADLGPVCAARPLVFVAERRGVESAHAVAAPLPTALCDPLESALRSLLDGSVGTFHTWAPDRDGGVDLPVAV
ncbi:MAG: hypothetical protein R2698_00800 [Microthrixaceae bacterium]